MSTHAALRQPVALDEQRRRACSRTRAMSSAGIGAAPQTTSRSEDVSAVVSSGSGSSIVVDRRHRREVGRPVASRRGQEGVGLKRAGDAAAAGQQRRERADHDAVDVEQRQDEQAAVGRRHAERGDHGGHRRDVGVVEHHALGLARRAAGVDEQRERVGQRVDRRAGGRRLLGERRRRRRWRRARARRRSRPWPAQSSTWYCISVRVSEGLTGVAAAPSRQAANSETTSSTRLGRAIATTSPAPTPRRASSAAARATRSAKAALSRAVTSSAMAAASGCSAARVSGSAARGTVKVSGTDMGAPRDRWWNHQPPARAHGRRSLGKLWYRPAFRGCGEFRLGRTADLWGAETKFPGALWAAHKVSGRCPETTGRASRFGVRAHRSAAAAAVPCRAIRSPPNPETTRCPSRPPRPRRPR